MDKTIPCIDDMEISRQGFDKNTQFRRFCAFSPLFPHRMTAVGNTTSQICFFAGGVLII